MAKRKGGVFRQLKFSSDLFEVSWSKLLRFAQDDCSGGNQLIVEVIGVIPSLRKRKPDSEDNDRFD